MPCYRRLCLLNGGVRGSVERKCVVRFHVRARDIFYSKARNWSPLSLLTGGFSWGVGGGVLKLVTPPPSSAKVKNE